MRKLDIVRAWKDEEYFNSLTEAERRLLPQNPAGLVELSDDDLGVAAGGQAPAITTPVLTISALGSCYSCITCPVATCITITFPITQLTVTP
jgi:mersacidin/lichenicidin family type 2 lantibiotic